MAEWLYHIKGERLESKKISWGFPAQVRILPCAIIWNIYAVNVEEKMKYYPLKQSRVHSAGLEFCIKQEPKKFCAMKQDK